MFASLSSDFDKQMQLVDECFALWQRSKSAPLTTAMKATLSQFPFEANHFLTHWKTILEPNSPSTSTVSQQNRLSNKKLIVTKSDDSPSSPSTINWKQLLPSLELLHNEQLIIVKRQELIRPLFQILEKSLNQAAESDQKTYIHQLCTTALLNIYTQSKSGSPRPGISLQLSPFSDECHPELFNSETVMECMKRTNDLHTTQQCLMLLSKGAQLFPVSSPCIGRAIISFLCRRN